MKKFSSFFKYCSDDPNVIEGIFKNHKIRLTQPWGMNDPLEFNPSLKFLSIKNPYQTYKLNNITMPSLELFYRVQLVESQINSYGILSLTKLPLSFDMWSKYANGHKGFLLELKPSFTKLACMQSKNGNEYIVKKVKYVKKYSLNLEKLVDENGDFLIENLKDIIFYSKSYRWKNEDEYRLVRPFSDILGYKPLKNRPHRDKKVYLFDFSLECVKSVVFGAGMSNKNKRYIAKQCSKYDIELYQEYILRNKYDEQKSFGDVRIININKFPSRKEFFNMRPYTFIQDRDKIILEDPVKLEKLEDLPYYGGNEKVVSAIYKNLTVSKK